MRTPKTSGLRSRLIRAQDLTPAEKSAWADFQRADPHLSSPFLSAHYTQAVGLARPLTYVCILECGRRIVGFFPFQFRNLLHRSLGGAERIGEEMTDYFGLIAEPGFRIDTQELLRLAGINYLYFSHLDQSQAAYGLIGEHPEPGLTLNFENCSDYWAQLKTVDRKLASETERLERKVQRQYGPLRFTWAADSAQDALGHLIDHKSSQYVRTGGTSIFAAHWRKDLLQRLAGSSDPSCSGVLSTLYAGDTWLASHFGIRGEGVLQYWFPVYNYALKTYAPGRLLLKEVILSAPPQGIRVLDRGGGDSPVKRKFTNSQHVFYRGVWRRPGLRSLSLQVLSSLAWRLKTPRRRADNGAPGAVALSDVEP